MKVDGKYFYEPEHDIEVIGFDHAVLHYVLFGICHGKTEEVNPHWWTLFSHGDAVKVQVDYLGFRYEVVGTWISGAISIMSIEKIAKVELISDEDESALMTPRPDLGIESGWMVVEDYRAQRIRKEMPEFGSW
jgi:hypothetical protein